MGIYIKNMKIPTAGHILIVFPSGRTLEVSADETQNIFKEALAISVRPHGKLKDYDSIMERYSKWFYNTESREYKNMFYMLHNELCNAPTIIPAEGASGKI